MSDLRIAAVRKDGQRALKLATVEFNEPTVDGHPIVIGVVVAHGWDDRLRRDDILTAARTFLATHRTPVPTRFAILSKQPGTTSSNTVPGVTVQFRATEVPEPNPGDGVIVSGGFSIDVFGTADFDRARTIAEETAANALRRMEGHQ